MPAYRVIVPPDAEAPKYGIPAGLRDRLRTRLPDRVGIDQGKISGLDYNLWTDFGLTRAEVVAVLKYTLDLRRKGNRAPMLLGMHSFYYSTMYTQPVPSATLADRRAGVLEFLTWALSTYPDVRVVPTNAVLDWIRNPAPLP